MTSHNTQAIARDRQYARLGITVDDVISQPQITHELRAIVRYLKEHNRPSNPYYYLACSDHPDAMAVLHFYRKFHHSCLVPIEAYCAAAKVSPLRVVEIVASTAIRLGAQASSIVAAASMPSVVHKSIEMALTDEGIDDRTLLAKATGFLPTPKGPQTSVHITQNASATAQSAALAAPVVAPAPEATIRRIADRFNTSRALPPTTAVPIPEASEEPVPVEVLSSGDDDEDLD